MRDLNCEELLNRIKNNIDVKSNMEQLYLKEKSLIEQIAKKHYKYNDFEDLCQVGYLGLDKAVKTYAPEAGCHFKNYAARCIEWEMIRYQKNNGTIIRVPSFMYDRVKKYKNTISNYYAVHGEKPDSEYIIKEMGFNSDQIDDIKNVINVLSDSICIDGAFTTDADMDDSLTLADAIPDPEDQMEMVIDRIERIELRNTLLDIINSLKGREPEILKKRYFEGKSSIKCSQELGISSQRVIQVEHNGIERIRKTKKNILQPYIEDIAFLNGLKDTGLNSFKCHGFESSVERDVIRLEKAKSHRNR